MRLGSEGKRGGGKVVREICRVGREKEEDWEGEEGERGKGGGGDGRI